MKLTPTKHWGMDLLLFTVYAKPSSHSSPMEGDLIIQEIAIKPL